MRTKFFRVLSIVYILLLGLSSKPLYAADASVGSLISIYVVPAITDEKILPTGDIPEIYISREIYISACPGEYEPASFVISAHDNIDSLEVSTTDLQGEFDYIPSSNVDIRVVKCWFQAGEKINEPYYNQDTKLLTPELLLKDDSLVKVENGENYLKMTTGNYVWISNPNNVTEVQRPTVTEFPVQDSDKLEPVNITSGTNKQFWITVGIPNNINPGIYNGTIQLMAHGSIIATIQLVVKVLPINLAEPSLTYSLYYQANSKFTGDGTISEAYLSNDQIIAQLNNLRNHGVTSPNCYQWWGWGNDRLGQMMSARIETGMSTSTFYYRGMEISDKQQDYDSLKNKIMDAKNFLTSYGVNDLYIYCPDEEEITEETRRQIDIAHEEGVNCFVALGKDKARRAADILDQVVTAYMPDAELAALYHSYGHKIFSYNNPQVGEENPETYRRNYGILLWQKDYDGAMDYGYMVPYGFVWNDFDHNVYRDHCFVYPTINGVIDTIQWEGWREAVDDIRYLSTLINVIEEAKTSGRDTSTAESWLANLKSQDLVGKDLDTIRSEIITHILSLSNINPLQLPNPIGDKSVTEGDLLTFTIPTTYLDSDYPSYSVLDLPEGAVFNYDTQTLSWTPNYSQAGTYKVRFTISSNPQNYFYIVEINVYKLYEDWDVNGDGYSDVLDIILIGQRWGEIGPIGWIREDVNEDGKVNVLDVIIVGQH